MSVWLERVAEAHLCARRFFASVEGGHLGPPLHKFPATALQKNLLHPFPRALTIAGFDPSGGAGVLADVRTFAAFGFQAAAAITSLTFQNAVRVVAAVHQSDEVVRAQLTPLLEDAETEIVCVKLGMLPTREVVLEVARLFQENDLPRPVIDPVVVSSSGYRLMEESALTALIEELLPLAQVVTPNIPEAETLTGITITSETDMRRAAAIIRELGARAVLIKGGHLKKKQAEGAEQEGGSPTIREGSAAEALEESDDAIDVLDNEGNVTIFRGEFIPGAKLHGSGCILSAAIAAGLGQGMTLEDSVAAAKSFVLGGLRTATRAS